MGPYLSSLKKVETDVKDRDDETFVPVYSEAYKKKKGFIDLHSPTDCEVENFMSHFGSNWDQVMKTGGYKAIVFNPEEYLDMMASEVHDNTKKKEDAQNYYDVPWMRRESDHRSFVDYVRDFVDITGFDNRLLMKKSDKSGHNTIGFYKQKNLLVKGDVNQKWDRMEKSIIGLFEFLDRHFWKLFPESLSWRKFTISKRKKKKKQKSKEKEVKWEKETVFGTLATEFFKVLESETLYQLSPDGISKIVNQILESRRIEFSVVCNFSGKLLFEFLIYNIIKRRSDDINFYYSDLCVLGKLLMKFLKGVKFVPKSTEEFLHEAFIKNSLSRMYRLMIALADKQMFLCFGYSDLKKTTHPVLKAFRNLISNVVHFGDNHVFFVLGGILFDYNNSEMIHIEPLARAKGARLLLKLKDEIEPVFIEKSFICSLIAELYWFNCFSKYKRTQDLQSLYLNDCQDVCRKLMKGVLKHKFKKVIGEKTIYPTQQGRKWKSCISTNDRSYVPSKDLKSKLLDIIAEKIQKKNIFEYFKKIGLFEHVGGEDLDYDSWKSGMISFQFSDRLALDEFAKTLFGTSSSGGCGIDLGYYPDDYVCLWGIDRALVVRVNDKIRKKLIETTKVDLSQYVEFQRFVKKGDKKAILESVPSDTKKDSKKKSIPAGSKFPWFFNRDKTINTFMAASIHLGTCAKKVVKSKVKKKSPVSRGTKEIVGNTKEASDVSDEEKFEFTEDHVVEHDLPLILYKYKDYVTRIIGNSEKAKIVEKKLEKEIGDYHGTHNMINVTEQIKGDRNKVLKKETKNKK